MREHAQTEMGNLLMLFTLRAVILQAATGGFCFLEHPANPHSLGTTHTNAPGIWLSAVIEWLQQSSWFCILDVFQGMYGQDSAKPTWLLLASISLNDARECDRQWRNPTCTKGSNVGLGKDGWKASHLKEYPPLFCRFIAAMFEHWIQRHPEVRCRLADVEWVRALVLEYDDHELPAPAPDFHQQTN